MNTRLQQFLIAENISQSQFADRIGVARASVSHIMAGRNKPGFDFIESMSRQFPTLNLDWLIMGKGKMYRDLSKASLKEDVAESQIHNDSNLFESDSIFAPEQAQGSPQARSDSFPKPSTVNAGQSHITESNTLSERRKTLYPQRSVSKIVVFYDDGTYQELK